MHRLCRNRGRRIRSNDKDLVFRTVFFLLFAVFAMTFVLLNIRTDWRSPSVAYLLFSAAMGVKVCTVTAWLLYRRFPDKDVYKRQLLNLVGVQPAEVLSNSFSVGNQCAARHTDSDRMLVLLNAPVEHRQIFFRCV